MAKKRGIGLKIGKAKPHKIAKKVETELRNFHAAHRAARIKPAEVRKKDEFVDFKHIERDIKRKLAAKAKVVPKAPPESLIFLKTGIRGLDKILGGGIPEEHIVLVSGGCGTGKTIFGMKFLVGGAMKGEPGVFVSFEESPDSTIKQMKLLGWPADRLISEKKLLIVRPELYDFDALLTIIEDAVEGIKAKRLVIDPASLIGMYFENKFKVRKALLDLGRLLKKINCTTIAIDEIQEGEPSLSAYGVEEFIVDGVIILYLIKRGDVFVRAITVRKMRDVKHSTRIYPMEIKKYEGIVVYP